MSSRACRSRARKSEASSCLPSRMLQRNETLLPIMHVPAARRDAGWWNIWTIYKCRAVLLASQLSGGIVALHPSIEVSHLTYPPWGVKYRARVQARLDVAVSAGTNRSGRPWRIGRTTNIALVPAAAGEHASGEDSDPIWCHFHFPVFSSQRRPGVGMKMAPLSRFN